MYRTVHVAPAVSGKVLLLVVNQVSPTLLLAQLPLVFKVETKQEARQGCDGSGTTDLNSWHWSFRRSPRSLRALRMAKIESDVVPNERDAFERTFANSGGCAELGVNPAPTSKRALLARYRFESP